MSIVYLPSQSMTVQGKRDKVFATYGKEWKIREQGKGNGNWLLTKKADVLVNGKSYRSFILDHYGKAKLTESLVKRFRADVEAKKILL